MTDVIPMQALLYRARRDLETANAKVGQAERAKEDAELEARRAEERARQFSDDADGWRMFAHNPDAAQVIAEHGPNLRDLARDRFIDHLYDLWAQGERIDNIDIQGLVNDYEENQS